MKRVLFIMIGATALLSVDGWVRHQNNELRTAAGKRPLLVVPVVELPKDVAASVNAAGTGLKSVQHRRKRPSSVFRSSNCRSDVAAGVNASGIPGLKSVQHRRKRARSWSRSSNCLPRTQSLRVNEAYWTEKHSQ